MEDGCEVISSWPPEAPEGAASGDDSLKDKSRTHSSVAPNSDKSTTRSSITPNSPERVMKQLKCDESETSPGDLRGEYLATVEDSPKAKSTTHSSITPSSPERVKRLKLDESESSPGDSRREYLATVGLARWWRREGQQLYRREEEEGSLPKSTSTNTLIKFIARTSGGQEFMRAEVRRLKQLIVRGEDRGDVHAALGTYYDKLRDFPAAEKHLSEAVKKNPEDKEHRWLLEKVKKQLDIIWKQEQSMRNLPRSPEQGTRKMKAAKQVERRSASSLSVKDFLLDYSMLGIPVILTDVVQRMTTTPWTLKHIKDTAGECLAPVKKLVEDSVEWAKLEDVKEMSVSTFLESLTEQPHYLFDWSLPLHCPKLAEELIIPKYFAGDFLQESKSGSLYQDSWPSLFIAPGGLKSELHIDTFGSNFWMALFEGRKRWVFFHKEDAHYLYPSYEHSTDATFEVDLAKPDFDTYPLLQLAEPMECILEPGELLFVPAGSPHRVENLETSLAISANFVDLSNFELVKDELRVNALVDPRAEQLLAEFVDPSFEAEMDSSIKDLPWAEFKSVKRPEDSDLNAYNVELMLYW